MKLVTLKNTLSGVLDLAPIKDDLGRNLSFRGNESRDLPAAILEEPLIQRVMASKWLVLATPYPAQPESSEPLVIKTEAPPEELKMPVMPEEAPPPATTPEETPALEAPAPVDEPALEAPAAAEPPPMRVETTITSETSVAPEPKEPSQAPSRSSKPTKPR